MKTKAKYKPPSTDAMLRRQVRQLSPVVKRAENVDTKDLRALRTAIRQLNGMTSVLLDSLDSAIEDQQQKDELNQLRTMNSQLQQIKNGEVSA